MIQLIEVYFKENNEVRNFFCESITEKDNVIKIKHGSKETLILRSDIKYYVVDKPRASKGK